MQNEPSYQPGRAVRTFDGALRLLTYLLTVATVLAVPLIVLGLMGKGSASVSSWLDGGYRVGFEDGRAIIIDNGVAHTYENFGIGAEHDTLTGRVALQASVQVGRDDRDARIVLAAMFTVYLTAAWVGLTSLRGITKTASEGEPFDPANARRLRRLGFAILAVPIADVLSQVALRATFDPDLPFVADVGGAPSWLVVVIALGVLALAEPFAEAARLRAFERATI